MILSNFLCAAMENPCVKLDLRKVTEEIVNFKSISDVLSLDYKIETLK